MILKTKQKTRIKKITKFQIRIKIIKERKSKTFIKIFKVKAEKKLTSSFIKESKLV